MTTFSATDVALSGFRFVRAHPRTIAIWGVLQLLLGFGFTALTIIMIGPLLAEARGGAQASLRSIGSLLGFYAVCIPLFLAYYAVVLAAMNRAVFTPQEDRFGYLRLGADEVRQMLLLGLTVVMVIALEVGLLVPLLTLGVIVSMAFKPLANLAMAFTPLLVFAGIAFVMVRLSVASPLTFDERKVRLFEAWKLTRGQFWKMLGTYVLAFLLSVAISLLIAVIAFAASALLGGGTDWAALFREPDFASLTRYFTASTIAFGVITSVGGALTLPLTLIPPIVIYRRLKDAAAGSLSA